MAEVTALHDGFVFFDEELAEFGVGPDFGGIFVDDEEGFIAVFWEKYITR